MRHLKKYKPLWIEEPTSPDDILGHAKIRKEIESFKIGVATGEMCANRIMFKQMFQAQAIDYCQIDSARLGGINEILAVYLMANKYEGKLLSEYSRFEKINLQSGIITDNAKNT